MSAAKRKLQGAPRWMVTFADMMALLFALFVLLLSFADVDSESFRKNAGPMRASFGHGGKIQDSVNFARDIREKSPPPVAVPSSDPEIVKKHEAKTEFLQALRSSMATETSQRLVELVIQDDHITVRFPDRTAFALGRAELSETITPTLDKIAHILKATKGQILVSGHTDNQPISTAQFRSNWDLAAARAVSVVHHLVDEAGLDPLRVTAQGFADSRPLVDNSTPENRAANRRVEISVEIESWMK